MRDFPEGPKIYAAQGIHELVNDLQRYMGEIHEYFKELAESFEEVDDYTVEAWDDIATTPGRIEPLGDGIFVAKEDIERGDLVFDNDPVTVTSPSYWQPPIRVSREQLKNDIYSKAADKVCTITGLGTGEPKPEPKVCPTLCFKCGEMHLTREGAIGCKCST